MNKGAKWRYYGIYVLIIMLAFSFGFLPLNYLFLVGSIILYNIYWLIVRIGLWIYDSYQDRKEEG